VIDADNNGTSKMVVIGNNGTNLNVPEGRLRIYESDLTPWAPARTIWNQYAYNPIYVNDDLTIPRYPLNPATVFIDRDGIKHQPFNNFLQQTTLLNDEGKMFRYAPNLEFETNSLQYSNQTGTNIDISFNIINSGDANFTGPLKISTYYYNNNTYSLLDSREFVGDIDQGISTAITYTITTLPVGIDPGTSIQIRLNELDGTFIEPECKYSDNFSHQILNDPNYRLMCEDETEILTFYPNNTPSFTYYWYDSNPLTNPGTATFLTTGDTYSFTKSSAAVDSLFIRVYDRDIKNWHDNVAYKLRVFLIPDSLEWTGNGNECNWNNPDNWFYPNNPDKNCVECIPYLIPHTCTNVLIPEGRSYYPNLTPTVSVPTFFPNTSCNRIWFRHGGEVARTDSLYYEEAYVDLKLQTNEWYMLSAPLKNMYSGDIYVSNPNPILDGYKIEPMLFNIANPETGVLNTNNEYKWTGSFSNPNEEFLRGQGVAVWVDEIGSDYTDHDVAIFQFPKPDLVYYYYYMNGTPTGTSVSVNKDKKNRFIYEEPNNKAPANGLVSLTASPVTNVDQVFLVGNPFMAHIGWTDFYNQNSALIQDEYRLAMGVSANNGKVNGFSTYKRLFSGGPYVTTYTPGIIPQAAPDLTQIPPMQSFLVQSKVASTPNLQADITKTYTQPGAILRSGSEALPPILDISAEMDGLIMSRNLLVYMENASSAYVPEEDSYTLFSLNSLTPVIVYTRSSDGYALDINSIGNFDQPVDVGIRTSQKGEIRLRFSGAEQFAGLIKIFLHDIKADRVIDLSWDTEYVFTKDEDDLYVENRLFLTFDIITDIHSAKSTSSISVQNLKGQSVRILSNDNSPLGNIQIMDIQGRVLVTEAVQSSGYIFSATIKGIYLVRVTNSEGTQVKRTVIN
jgi:hypothetical protein